MSNNEIDIHMSDLDEETKRILAEVNTDAQSGTDDSKLKSKKKYPDKQITIQYDDTGAEINTQDTPDSEW